jgi:hypothetical protein
LAQGLELAGRRLSGFDSDRGKAGVTRGSGWQSLDPFVDLQIEASKERVAPGTAFVAHIGQGRCVRIAAQAFAVFISPGSAMWQSS